MIKWCVLVLAVALVSVHGQSSAIWQGGLPCLILDSPSPVIETGFQYFVPSPVEGHRKLETSRWYGRWEGAYFQSIALGDIDLAITGEYRALLRSGGDSLSDRTASVTAMAVDAGWTWRYVNDMALQLRMRPGLYTELKKPSLKGAYLPVSVTGLWRLHRTLSIKGGAEARAGYHEVWLPLVGLAWQPFDRLRLDLMSPTSRLELRWTPRWRTDIGVSRVSDSFALTSGKKDSPERVTFKDYRATTGITRMLNEELFMRVEVGWVYNRDIRFDRGSPTEKASIDDNVVIGLSLVGPF